MVTQTGSLILIDVNNPSAPRWRPGASLLGRGKALSVEGTRVAVISRDVTTYYYYLEIFNISDSSATPVRIGLATDTLSTFLGVYVRGDLA